MWYGSYNTDDDAYKYDRDGRTIQRVEILLDRIPQKTLAAVEYCMENKFPFILKNEDSAVGFWPLDMSYIAPHESMTCMSLQQYMNVIKLFLISHPDIHMPARKLPSSSVGEVPALPAS